MANHVEEFKNEWREKIRSSPESYFPNKDLKGTDTSKVEVSFADDKAIENHLSGKTKIAGGICCLVSVKIPPFGGSMCVMPPGGDPDNMCIQ